MTTTTFATDMEALKSWAIEFQTLQETLGSPITGPEDPRYQQLIDSAGNYAVNGPVFPLSFIQELLEDDTAGAGELYFLRYAQKPEPPVATPSWAVTKEIHWGFPQEVEMLFTSNISVVGELKLGWHQIVSIQMFDDQTRERLHQPVLHESEVEFFIRDSSNSLLLEGDIDTVSMLGAAIEDSVRDFASYAPKELHRHTEPGQPEHYGLGGGL